jgi:putative transposon-encoded protein
MFKPFGSIMRTIELKKGKIILRDEIEEIVEGEVKKIGNGGMILSAKKYIGKKVYVLIRK